MEDAEIKKCIRKAVLQKHQEGSYASAKKMFYVVRRFLELNDREVHFNKTEKKLLLKRIPKKIGKEYVPTREDIYRMVDAFPNKGPLQWRRGKAIILCLWQSGVRVNCLCSWTYGIFKDQLWNGELPIEIKVVANRPKGVYNVSQDTKLSAYSVNYYYAFLAKEAAEALRNYLDERIKHGWVPKDNDPVFVTHGTASQGKSLNAQHVIGIVKNAAKQIGIDPATIWTHCLRKAFRKTLYASGVDPDIAEALMGHKLGASRGSYFDYHDVNFVKESYLRAHWDRLGLDRLRKMEKEIVELRKSKQELDMLKQNGYQKAEKLEKLLERIEALERKLAEKT